MPSVSLISLPYEIRQRILAFAIVQISIQPFATEDFQPSSADINTSILVSPHRNRKFCVGLLEVNKQLRNESLPMFWAQNCFVITDGFAGADTNPAAFRFLITQPYSTLQHVRNLELNLSGEDVREPTSIGCGLPGLDWESHAEYLEALGHNGLELSKLTLKWTLPFAGHRVIYNIHARFSRVVRKLEVQIRDLSDQESEREVKKALAGSNAFEDNKRPTVLDWMATSSVVRIDTRSLGRYNPSNGVYESGVEQ